MISKVRPSISQLTRSGFFAGVFALVFSLPGAAFACSDPTGVEGEIVYNSHFKTMLFCNGTSWVDMGSGGAVSGSLTASGKWDDGTNAADAVYPTGNVGIGTNNPTTKLEIKGDGTNDLIQIFADDGAIQINREGGGPYIDFSDSASDDYDARIQMVGDGLQFTTGGNAGGAVRMSIDAAGSVGIGTISPSTALHVSGVTTTGSLIIGGVSGQPAPAGGGTNVQTTSILSGWPDVLKCWDTVLELSNHGGSDVYYYQANNGTYGARFDKTTKTHVQTYGWANLSACDGMTVDQLYANGYAFNLVNTNSVNGGGQFSPGATSGSAVYQGGNVGIGTDSPARSLHIYGSIGTELVLERTDQTADLKRFNVFLDSDKTYFRSLNDAGNGGTVWLSADNATGNVGIGAGSAPNATAKLSVAGTIESTTGGIKFPDGTVQMTASSGSGSSLPDVTTNSWIRGAYDWSGDQYALGGVWDGTHKGLRYSHSTLGTYTWVGPKLPVNPGQNWRMVIRVKNVGSVNSVFYAGVHSFDHNGVALFTDAMGSFNYHVASNIILAPGSTQTFSATIGGWNPVGGVGSGFDPDAAFFSPIMLPNYNSANAEIVVQGISVFPVP